MVMLHDAIKTIQNGVFPFHLKEQKLVSFKNTQKTHLKKTGGLFFLNLGFSQPCYA